MASLGGKEGIAVEEGAALGSRTAQQGCGDAAAGNEHSSCSESGTERMDGESGQPPLEVMVGLIVDQLVGRAPSATAREHTSM